MNKSIIMGRLTRDPELKYTTSNVAVVSFTVAVDRAYKPKDGEREADFINCVAWRQTAEFLSKWFTKGRMIAVSGSIQTRKYTDRDGNNRTATEIVAEDVYFCGDKGGASDSRPSVSTHPEDMPKSPAQSSVCDFHDITGDDDELPF